MLTFKNLNLTQKQATIIAILIVILTALIAFFYQLGNIGLIDKTEPMFVEAARQMVITGDWLTPYWNDATRFDKPPLIYWLMAISFKIFGINEMAARLPSALFGLLTVLLVFYLIYLVNQKILITQENPDLTNHKNLLIATIGALITILNPA